MKIRSPRHLLIAASAAILLTLSACGGGGNTVPLGSAKTPLSTTAPATVYMSVGQTSTFGVNGGSGNGGTNFTTYSASDSTSAVATTTLTPGQANYTITALAAGTDTVTITDTGGDTKTVTVNVGTTGSTSSSAIYIAAPAGGITVGEQIATEIAILAGSGNYTVASSNSTIVDASLSGKTLVITGISPGTATLSVFDTSNGNSASIAITVAGAGAASPLIVEANSILTIPYNATVSYPIKGGTAPYHASSNNDLAITASVTGNLLNLTGVASDGSATVNVYDAAGNSVVLGVSAATSATGAALFTTAPTGGITVSAGSNATFTIGAGAAPYAVTTASAAVAKVALTGNSFTITGVAAGTTTVAVTDSLGAAVQIAVTVH